MTSEAVKVIVRCRPLNEREIQLNSETIVAIDSSCAQCCLTNPNDRSAPPKTFSFDGAYHMDSTTEQIYNEIVFPIVESVTEGYNGTVFAYGQTGCGKSFTMQGTPEPVHRGIIPRAFEHIFEAISTTEKTKFLVQASYLEIYNEEVRDLLGDDCRKKLDLKESSDTGVYVANLSLHIVNDVQSCERIMQEGWKNRSVGATLMNADSSRSHSIFTIYIERISTDARESDNVKFGKLNLVDLAGSERQTKTGATGDRLKEATKINLSLSALGNVISALVDGKSKHIPFRDSKLTRLLQDSLGGNTKTLMVACVSPADNNYDETLSTLRYANRAKNIKNKPKINEDPKDALLRQYKEEILTLKKLVENQVSVPDNPKSEVDENVIEKIKQDYDQKIQGLVKKYEEDIDKLKSTYQGNEQSQGDNDENKEPLVFQKIEKLQAIEVGMVGGEKANDTELKEKRAKKKKIAEAKLNAINETTSKLNDDDRVLLRAYGDITEELRAKTMILKKAKRKIQSLEQEVRDLQSEFESERTDYLESIRKQDKQIKLYGQVFERIQPLHKDKCQYRNIDDIRNDSRWDDNGQQWILPQLSGGRLRFPPAIKSESVMSNTEERESSHSRYKPDSPTSIFDNDIIKFNASEDKLLTKLNNSDNVEIVSNYFMPKRREQLLNNLSKLKTNAVSNNTESLEKGYALGLSKSANQISELTSKLGERAFKLNEQFNNSLSRKGLGAKDGKYVQDK